MTDSEKLALLIRESLCFGYDDITDTEYVKCEETAKKMIAHGVTVLECKKNCANCWKTQLVTPRWIPVTERLPEYGEFVIVFDYYNCVFIGKRDERFEGMMFRDVGGHYATTAAFWMPLPQPPKGE